MEKERKVDLQSLWDVTQGSRDEVQHSTHCACLYGSCRHSVCPPHKLTALSGCPTNTLSGDTVAPESRWLGNPLSTKCQHGGGKRWWLPGAHPPQFLEGSPRRPRGFPEVK